MSAKPPISPSFPSHTATHSLFPLPTVPILPQVHHPHMDPNVVPQPRYPSTCIPSLMPPGVDPTSVDFRTFFPYIPNEVKHRKRTSRHQLKVLEDVFRKDTKPNAVLRKKLAADLDMSPRAVQVWFQNRRAKEKALRKRVAAAADQDTLASPSCKKSPPPRDSSPNDSSSSSTPTEQPPRHAEDDASSRPPPGEPSASPALKLSCSPPPLPASPSMWAGFSTTPLDVPPHVRPLDPMPQDPDLYNTRRGSLPTMPSQPLVGPQLTPPPIHYPDRRKSMDVSCLRLMHHPFARIAKEKNEALYLPKSPLAPAGSVPAHHLTRPPGIGPIRTNSHGYPLSRPTLSHRASEPQVFATARALCPPVPEGGPLQSIHAPARRFSDNRLYAISSRTISSPIPGPLPTPDFQFGDPSSVSPPNASPTPGEVESSPSLPLQSPEMAQLQRWSFPRSREPDQDTEDSGSYSGLSRFGSVASVSGSESSAMFSDVSSCVAVDHIAYDPSSTRRGSCASGNYLEMQLSGLNVTGRSSQGSLNEAQLSTAAALAFRDKLARQEDTIGGYVSPASTASPGTSPHIRQVKEPGPSALRSEGLYDYGSLSQLPQNADLAAARRASMQEALPNIYVQNPIETQGAYPASPTEARGSSSVQPAIPQQHYPHAGNFTPQAGYASSGEATFIPGSGSTPTESSYSRQQSTHLQYPSEGTLQGAPDTMSHANVSRYAPPAGEYTYAAGHGQEPFTSFS